MAAAAPGDGVTVIQFLDLSSRPGPCGYCKGQGSISQGMFVKRMTVEDYQDLLDRGWRRSGRYVYKPLMEATCCPLYTIRCLAAQFSLSKSQRKVVKKFNTFLVEGPPLPAKEPSPSKDKLSKNLDKPASMDVVRNPELANLKRVEGLKKKKVLRMEKRLEKRLGKTDAKKEPRVAANQPKTLAELLPARNFLRLNESVEQEVGAGAQHTFSLKMVRASMHDPAFMASFEESYTVYRRYQLTVHGDSPSECDMHTFAQFLCDSPLVHKTMQGVELGAFHQQYLVDGRIVAVAVLDILPNCLSSVYLYYDPQFWGPRLSPGTYSAVREVQLTVELSRLLPSLQHYYMGYYVHSCPKMRYKGHFRPCHLLSPSQLSWHPLAPCLALLEGAKYSSLQEVAPVAPAPQEKEGRVAGVRLLVGDKLTNWGQEGGDGPVPSRLTVYLSLVGQALAERMALAWEGDEEEQDFSDSE